MIMYTEDASKYIHDKIKKDTGRRIDMNIINLVLDYETEYMVEIGIIKEASEDEVEKLGVDNKTIDLYNHTHYGRS